MSNSTLKKKFREGSPHYITSNNQLLTTDIDTIVIDDWLKMIFGNSKNIKEYSPSVVIGNIHQIKGEEFSHVFICGFKRIAKQKGLYVGITRAKEKAYICPENQENLAKILVDHRCVYGTDYIIKSI